MLGNQVTIRNEVLTIGDFPLKWLAWTAFYGMRPPATCRLISFLRLHCRSHHYRGKV